MTASAFAKKRKVQPGETEYMLGWCVGPIGAVLQHQPLGPDEQPVDPVDKDGNRIPGFCPGQQVAMHDGKTVKKGTVCFCQCPCHGPDRPEAYPGYYAARAAAAKVEDTYEAPAAPETPVEDVPLLGVVSPAAASEPPLPQLGDPSDSESEAVTDAPASAGTPAWVDDGHERTETKVFSYPNGSVTRTERQSVTRQGKDVTLVEWIAKLPDGTKVGSPQWSRKAAKELLP